MRNKRLFITAGIILVSLVFTVAGYILLPDTLVMQITYEGGNPTTMPKIFGLLLSFGLSVGFAVGYYYSEEPKNLIGSAVGLLSFIFAYFMNV